jgi:hypothetical protein
MVDICLTANVGLRRAFFLAASASYLFLFLEEDIQLFLSIAAIVQSANFPHEFV